MATGGDARLSSLAGRFEGALKRDARSAHIIGVE